MATCSECAFWTRKNKRTNNGVCSASVPMWALIELEQHVVISGSKEIYSETDIDDCQCYRDKYHD